MNLFKNILIPVNEEMDVSVAIKKALELKDDTAVLCIHFVLYNYRNSLINILNFFKRKKIYNTKIYNQLFQERFYILKNEIAKQCMTCVLSIDIIPANNVTNGLLKYIKENSIDLLLFSKRRSEHSLLLVKGININKIARKSSCSVLSAVPGCLNHSVKSIILPVGSFLPEKKIQIAIAFAQKYKGLIHLVTLLDDADEAHSKKKVDIFYKTYKILQECGFTPQYKILSKYESHESLLKYAEQVKADLILLTPQKDSFISGKSDNSIVDFISPYSHLLVLMTKPNMVA